MSRFLLYRPDQAYQLSPSVKDELGEDPLHMFLHRVVERLDLREFENAYSHEGGVLYAPWLMLKVWLYAYALACQRQTSSHAHTFSAAVNAFNSVKALAAEIMASSLSAPSATLQPRLILRFASRMNGKLSHGTL
jgi:hypothetical protein